MCGQGLVFGERELEGNKLEVKTLEIGMHGVGGMQFLYETRARYLSGCDNVMIGRRYHDECRPQLKAMLRLAVCGLICCFNPYSVGAVC
jgi:hypothetical protein